MEVEIGDSVRARCTQHKMSRQLSVDPGKYRKHSVLTSDRSWWRCHVERSQIRVDQ